MRRRNFLMPWHLTVTLITIPVTRTLNMTGKWHRCKLPSVPTSCSRLCAGRCSYCRGRCRAAQARPPWCCLFLSCPGREVCPLPSTVSNVVVQILQTQNIKIYESIFKQFYIFLFSNNFTFYNNVK